MSDQASERACVHAWLRAYVCVCVCVCVCVNMIMSVHVHVCDERRERKQENPPKKTDLCQVQSSSKSHQARLGKWKR